jgi:hypothetical protein
MIDCLKAEPSAPPAPHRSGPDFTIEGRTTARTGPDRQDEGRKLYGIMPHLPIFPD